MSCDTISTIVNISRAESTKLQCYKYWSIFSTDTTMHWWQ